MKYPDECKQEFLWAQRIPKRTLDALHAWRDRGIRPGTFVSAVLENNLCEAVCHADEENLAALVHIVKYAYNELPAACWGSKSSMAIWRARFERPAIDPACVRTMPGTLRVTRVAP